VLEKEKALQDSNYGLTFVFCSLAARSQQKKKISNPIIDDRTPVGTDLIAFLKNIPPGPTLSCHHPKNYLFVLSISDTLNQFRLSTSLDQKQYAPKDKDCPQ